MRLWELFNDRVVSITEAQKPAEKSPLITSVKKTTATNESVTALLKSARSRFI